MTHVRAAFLIGSLAFLWCLAPARLLSQVLINEWMGDNETFVRDADGDFSDWLELRNVGEEAVDLSGWQIGIDGLWSLPEGVVLEAGGFLVLWASGKDAAIDGEYHTDFTIPTREWDPSSRAPNMRLLDADGSLVSKVKLKEQEEDEAHGWIEVADGTSQLVLTRPPTPGGPNLRLAERAPWILSPSGNSLLRSSEVVFDWSALALDTAEEYFLDVGTEIVATRGHGDIFNRSVGSALSVLATGIPLCGRRVYATLWTRIGEVWLRSVDSYRTDAPIVINEVMVDNRAAVTDEDGDHSGWIELKNTGATEIGLEGFRIFLHGVGSWSFSDVRLAAGGYLMVWASGKNREDPARPLHTSFSLEQSEEIRLDLLSPSGSWLQVVSVPRGAADTSWARMPDGTGDFSMTSFPTPGSANADSDAPGDGSTRFLRGDANDDRSVGISDAAFVLCFVFQGCETPACLDAGDANDDGAVDVSDAVSILTYLFLGGAPLPHPFPGCGEDPSADALDCAAAAGCR